LIGWTSTADALENVGRAAMSFASSEDAASFCQRHGWEYEVRQPHARQTTRSKRFLGYGDNYR
jgi:NADH dehydrogenase (ubiquinone) Fe-S protein 4